MSLSTPQQVQELEAAKTSRVWHICTGAHALGNCRPGCIAYCGKEYGGKGRHPRSSEGVPRIDICVICQGLKHGNA